MIRALHFPRQWKRLRATRLWLATHSTSSALRRRLRQSLPPRLAARDQMRRWGGDEDTAVGDEPADPSTALDLAMSAGAATARRQYDLARRPGRRTAAGDNATVGRSRKNFNVR